MASQNLPTTDAICNLEPIEIDGAVFLVERRRPRPRSRTICTFVYRPVPDNLEPVPVWPPALRDRILAREA